jgi:hypothetical protein
MVINSILRISYRILSCTSPVGWFIGGGGGGTTIEQPILCKWGWKNLSHIGPSRTFDFISKDIIQWDHDRSHFCQPVCDREDHATLQHGVWCPKLLVGSQVFLFWVNYKEKSMQLLSNQVVYSTITTNEQGFFRMAHAGMNHVLLDFPSLCHRHGYCSTDLPWASGWFNRFKWCFEKVISGLIFTGTQMESASIPSTKRKW